MAALLSLPLGVARVLLADMVEIGLVLGARQRVRLCRHTGYGLDGKGIEWTSSTLIGHGYRGPQRPQRFSPVRPGPARSPLERPRVVPA
ncbi:MAG: hypothetical protein ACRDRA_20665 [Pseudonocardiaceae bacterium]